MEEGTCADAHFRTSMLLAFGIYSYSDQEHMLLSMFEYTVNVLMQCTQVHVHIGPMCLTIVSNVMVYLTQIHVHRFKDQFFPKLKI